MYNNEELKKIILNEKGNTIRSKINDPNIKLNILYNTSFLNEYNSLLIERLYCIKQNITEIVKCNYCSEKAKYCESSSRRYYNTCINKECMLIHKRNNGKKITDKRWENHQKPIKIKISKEERYKKAAETRRKNNPDWFTEDQKKYIKQKRDDYFSLEENTNNKIKKLKDHWKDPIRREKQSNLIKNLIKEGVFTPPITNTWTHWESKYIFNGKEYKFRSSWEAAFWSVNKDLEFEKLRIPYVYNNKNHTYIVDFIDYNNNIVYEIKPDDKFLKKEKIKEQYLIEWCKNNNFQYKLITNSWFFENYNKIDFNNNEWLLNKMKQFKND
jgi:hypothetical protein